MDEQRGNQTRNWPGCFRQGAARTLVLSKRVLSGAEDGGGGARAIHSKSPVGGPGTEEMAKEERASGRCPCLASAPTSHDTGWQSPRHSHAGLCTLLRAGLRPQITAGWVGLAGLRQEVRTNFR